MKSLKKSFVENYVKSVEILKIERKIMGLIGCWLDQSVFHWKPMTGLFCHLFLNLFPKCNYVINAFAASDGKKFAKCVPESFIVIWYFITSIILMYYKRTFKELYQLLLKNWEDGGYIKEF